MEDPPTPKHAPPGTPPPSTPAARAATEWFVREPEPEPEPEPTPERGEDAPEPDSGIDAPGRGSAPGSPDTGVIQAPAVSATAISKTYGSGDAVVHALTDITLTIEPGTFTAITGPSGSGKSTLMHILAGLDTPTTGQVAIAGTPLQQLSDRRLTELRRAHVGFVFQSYNLLPTLTLEENVRLPLQLARQTPDPVWIATVLAATGLTDRRNHRPAELSGGQQQRAAIARAIVTRPSVVFADEPTGNLDSQAGSQILNLLRDAVNTHDQTVVLVTHDPAAAERADRTLALADGRLSNPENRAVRLTTS